MTNLVLTHACNQRCAFCFTDFLSINSTEQMVSPDRFKDMLTFLRNAKFPQIRLLGGEPTLHPQFPDLLRLASEEGKKIIIFSNGILPEKSLLAIQDFDNSNLIVLININVYFQNLPNTGIKNRIKDVLSKLEKRGQLGFTIQNNHLPLAEMITLIQEFGLAKSIRLGLAQPTSRENRFMPARQYPLIGQKIIDAAEKAMDNDIKFELDCGFVRCMFPGQIKGTFTISEDPTFFSCSPIIDLDLDGSAVACFPLSEELRMSNALLHTRQDVIRFFNEKLKNLHGIGIYPECNQCIFLKNQECSGGCLAMVLKRFQMVS